MSLNVRPLLVLTIIAASIAVPARCYGQSGDSNNNAGDGEGLLASRHVVAQDIKQKWHYAAPGNVNVQLTFKLNTDGDAYDLHLSKETVDFPSVKAAIHAILYAMPFKFPTKFPTEKCIFMCEISGPAKDPKVHIRFLPTVTLRNRFLKPSQHIVHAAAIKTASKSHDTVLSTDSESTISNYFKSWQTSHDQEILKKLAEAYEERAQHEPVAITAQ